MCGLLLAAALSTAVPHAGVIEGFYGRPWPHAGRVELMKFLGDCALNTYIYGPKDDPYHHTKWREQYPEPKLAEFRELLAAAKSNQVDFVWAVHLGDAFQDRTPAGMEAEYRALFAKLEAMYAVGFRSFAAFFDDFGKSDAALHAEVANRIVADFLDKKGDCSDLVICPHDYTGDGSGEYCRKLGEQCGPRVQIMWTGPSVCGDIPKSHTEKVTANYRRPPYVWWNWPCNDFNRGKLIMGPLYGVDAAPLAGFVVNPMEDLEASKIGIFCAAEFAKNPAEYEPKIAWRKGLRVLYGEQLGAAMEVFCEHNSDSSGGPRSQEGWIAFWNRLESERLAADGDLKQACTEIREAMKLLLEELPLAHPTLWEEIKWWIHLQDAQALEGLAALAADRDLYETAKGLRVFYAERQKALAVSLAPDWDKKNCTVGLTGTRVLQPMIDAAAGKAFEKAE